MASVPPPEEPEVGAAQAPVPRRFRLSRPLVYVLVVGVIFGICAGIVLPSVNGLKQAAGRSQCTSHFKQLALALHSYNDTNNGRLPAGAIPHADLLPEARLSWCVSILPHIEQKEIFAQFDLKAGVQVGQNREAADHQIRLFLCPSSAEFDRYRRDNALADPITQYVGVAGVGADAPTLANEHPRSGSFGYDRRRSLASGFPDGTSNTLLLTETSLDNAHWARGGAATVRPVEQERAPHIGRSRSFGGFHPPSPPWFAEEVQTCNVAMADGSIRVIRPTIAPEVLAALATAGGKEELPKDW